MLLPLVGALVLRDAPAHSLVRKETALASAAVNTTALLAQDRAEARRPWTTEEVCFIAASYPPAPDLCPMGAGLFTNEALTALVPTFSALKVKQNEAFKRDGKETPHCCMGVNHQFAVFVTVAHLKPLAVIESGVAAGHGTWLLRELMPDAPIFSIDPIGPDVQYPFPGSYFVGYRDPNPKTTYFTDANFQDFATVDWGTVIPDPAVRAQTLVLLDDHQSSVERLKVMQKWGFRYFFYEDNYAFPLATMADDRTCGNLLGTGWAPQFDPKWVETRGDCYTTSAVCSSPPAYAAGLPVLHKDKFGSFCSLLTPQQHMANVQYMQANLETYFEFPALFTPPCPGLTVSRAPLLTEAQLAPLGLPAPNADIWTYVALHPPFGVLKATPPVR